MRHQLGRYAPWPFVGVAVLLVVMIVITPVLVSNGQPPPGVLTQAELIVDRIPGAAATHFYVRGLGVTTRYAAIHVGAASNFSWDGTGSMNWSSLHFSAFWNGTNLLSLQFSSGDNPIALNITAYYQSPAGNALYVGEIAFWVGPASGSSGQFLFSATATAGLAVSAQTPVDNSSLPLLIVLSHVPSGGPPV